VRRGAYRIQSTGPGQLLNLAFQTRTSPSRCSCTTTTRRARPSPFSGERSRSPEASPGAPARPSHGAERNEGEKWVDYLHRLAVIEEKELHEQFKKIAEQFSEMGSFSKKLQDQIKDTFSLGESLKKSYESFNIPREFVSKPRAR
jgi:hypothetical protein